MARTAPVPDIPPLPGMCPSIAVMAGGGDAGGGGGAGAGSGDGRGGAGAGSGGEGAQSDSRSAPGARHPEAARASHPIDVATGRAYTFPAVDVELPGPLPLTLERLYSSSLRDRDIGLGYGWTHTLGWTIEVGRREVIVWTAEGIAIDLPLPPAGGEALGPFGWLVRNAVDRLEVDACDGLLRTFLSRDALGRRHRLSYVEDRSRNRITITYDGPRVSSVTDSAGRLLGLTADTNGRVTAIAARDPRGAEVVLARYLYDQRGDLVEAVDAEGSSRRYTYDDRHLLVEEVDRAGLTFHFLYDEEARCVESWGDYPGRADPSLAPGLPKLLADGVTRARGVLHARLHYYSEGYVEVADASQVRRFFSNRHGKMDKRVEGAGVTSCAYDDGGHLIRWVDPLGAVVSYERDARGHITKIIDPLGRTRSFTRDARGLVIEEIDPNGGETTTLRDTHGRPVAVTSPDGATQTWEYDDRGLVTKTLLPNGAFVTMDYDAHGNAVALHLPNGASWRWSYDGFGRRTEEIDPTGAVTRYGWSRRGEVVTTTDALGRVTRTTYDGEGRPVEVAGPGGGTTRVTWGGFHRMCTCVDPAGNALVMKYNHDGDPVEIHNEVGEVHTLAYDSSRRVILERTFDGRKIRYAYDAAGRLRRRIDHGRGATEYVYDPAGQLIERRSPDGDAERFEYDGLGGLTSVTFPRGEITFERDAAGAVIRETQRLGGDVHEVRRALDASGKLVCRSTSLGPVERIERDAMGVRARTWLGAEERLIEHRCDALGRELGVRLPSSARIESGLDALGRLTERRVVRAGEGHGRDPREPMWTGPERGLSTRLAYQYDVAGELAGELASGGERTRYVYDPLGQILAMIPERARAIAFRHDPSGNLSLVGEEREHGPGNRLLRRGDHAYRWDEDGQLVEQRSPGGVQRYRWSAVGQLASVERADGAIIELDHDPLDRRLAKRVYRATPRGRELVKETRFVWDGDVLVHEITTLRTGAAAVTEERTYLFAEGGFAPFAHRTTRRAGSGAQDTGWLFYVNDVAGAPRWIVSEEGDVKATITLTPFQRAVVAGPPEAVTPIRYQGQYEDMETGLSYNRARYYDAAAARYISPDPMGLAGGANAYRYGKNPLRYIDPYGETLINITGDRQDAPDRSGWLVMQTHGNEQGARTSPGRGLGAGFCRDPRAFAQFLRDSGHQPGQPVILVACYTGASDNGQEPFAQRLSRELGVPVRAPNGHLVPSALPWGRDIITPHGGEAGSGHWVEFRPDAAPRALSARNAA